MKLAVATLAMALVAASCAAEAGAPRSTVVIRIRHSRFLPSTIEVAAGTTVRFEVVNEDPIDHELIIGDAEVQRVHERGTETHHGAKPGEVSVPAGERRSTTLSFERPGRLIFGCHLPGHYDYGMRGTLRIT